MLAQPAWAIALVLVGLALLATEVLRLHSSVAVAEVMQAALEPAHVAIWTSRQEFSIGRRVRHTRYGEA
jgi:hypothetical protein